MPGPGWRRLDVAELAPVDGLEAALLAVVRGEIHGATLQRVADLLGGRAAAEPGAPLPGALLERRLCPLEAEERVDRAALLALWALGQPLAQVVAAHVASRIGGEVVWADAVLRVARDDGRPVIVGAASVGWAIADDPIAQTLVELFADVKRRLLETVTVQALREQLGRGRADHDDPKPGDCAGPGSSGPSR